MAYVDIKALVTSFRKVTQWLATSKRMLLIVSPFLAIVAVLVWLAIVSIDILTAGRAYVEGESLWSKNQKEAVFHLLRFAETKSESDFLSYRKAIMVPLGFQRARFELEKTAPDYSAVRAGFIEGGTHPVHAVSRDHHGRRNSSADRDFPYTEHGEPGRPRRAGTQGTQAGTGIRSEARLPCEPRSAHQSGQPPRV